MSRILYIDSEQRLRDDSQHRFKHCRRTIGQLCILGAIDASVSNTLRRPDCHPLCRYRSFVIGLLPTSLQESEVGRFCSIAAQHPGFAARLSSKHMQGPVCGHEIAPINWIITRVRYMEGLQSGGQSTLFSKSRRICCQGPCISRLLQVRFTDSPSSTEQFVSFPPE